MQEEKYIYYRQDRQVYQVKIRVNGKTITKSLKTLKSAISVRDNLVNLYKLNENILSAMIPSDSKIEPPTFEQGFNDYIKDKEYTLRPSSIQNHRTTLRMFSYYIGKLRIDKINAETWQELCVSIKEQKHLKYNYFIKSVKRIKAMYDYYVGKHIIAYNPLKTVKIRNTDRTTPRRAFTKSEKERFLATAKDYNYIYYLLYTMYFETGCRRGELLALQWKDINFEDRYIDINKTVSRGTVDGEYQELLNEPKTKQSIRQIPISKVVAFALMLIMKNRKADENDFIFKGKYGNGVDSWMRIDVVTQTFARIRAKAGLPKELKLHCIRHTFASNLVCNGVDLTTIMGLCGWSSPEILLKVYSHTNTNKKAQVMAQYVF